MDRLGRLRHMAGLPVAALPTGLMEGAPLPRGQRRGQVAVHLSPTPASTSFAGGMSVDNYHLKQGHPLAMQVADANPAGGQRTAVPAAAGAEQSQNIERAMWRKSLREQALRSAMQKRAAGVPTYSVPEAAALMSVSQEYLYRLIQANAFPAVHMRLGAGQGRYVVPARAVERLLNGAAEAGSCVESADAANEWRPSSSDGVA
jgi:excisionase family DNA binding protein